MFFSLRFFVYRSCIALLFFSLAVPLMAWEVIPGYEYGYGKEYDHLPSNASICQTSGGTLSVYFVNGPEPVYDTSTTPLVSAELFTNFTAAVMRGMDTIERTFANKPSRQIHIGFKLAVLPNSELGGSSRGYVSPYNQKTTWNSGDLGSNQISSDKGAYVNNIENYWKYGRKAEYEGDTPRYYVDDATISFYGQDSSLAGFYYGEDTDGYTAGLVDVESVTVHEMGHVLGFYASNKDGANTALEMLTELKDMGPLGQRYYFMGNATLAANGGQGIWLEGGNPTGGHIMQPKGMIMNGGHINNGVLREFTPVELAMFQDMGWTLSVPEPSSACFAAVVAVLFLRRRRR